MRNVLALLLFLTACEQITIEDGKIPSEYLESAHQFTGTFVNEYPYPFRGELTLKIDNGVPIFSFQGERSTDLLGKGCHSQIGPLKSIVVNDMQLKGLVMGFDPGECGEDIEGRELNIEFNSFMRKNIFLSLFQYIGSTTYCDDQNYYNRCRVVKTPVFLEAAFSKKKE